MLTTYSFTWEVGSPEQKKKNTVAQGSQIRLRKSRDLSSLCTVGQVVKTLPFHGSNGSSILLRCIVENSITFSQKGGVGSSPA